MCANYEAPDPDLVAEYFSKPPNFGYLADVYPGRRAPMIRLSDVGEPICMPACFGLIPRWSKDTKLTRSTYNARSETVATKPSFRESWKGARFALVPLQSFYEPRYGNNGKSERWRIFRRDGRPFAAAAIWAGWIHQPTGERIESFSMLTIDAGTHDLMRHFHRPEDEKRSIVLLAPEQYSAWLDLKDPALAVSFLKAFNPAEYDAIAAPRPKKGAVQPALI